MTLKRLSREDIRTATGNFNPTGHAVLAFGDSAVSAQAEQALHAVGFTAEDVLAYTSEAVKPRLQTMVDTAGQGAGFGYEITLLRRYLVLAGEGCGWLIVYCPEDDATARVTEVAARFEAKSAVKYNRLVNEELV